MKQTLIVFVRDEPGVLNRVSSLIRKRNFNIDSLIAGRTDKTGITRLTIVLNEPDKTKQKIVVNNLKKLIDVYDVVDATDIACHIREYLLVKIRISDMTDKIGDLIDSDYCRVLEEKNDVIIAEFAGSEKTIQKVISEMKTVNILELMCSGKMAMISGFNKAYQPELIETDPNIYSQVALD